MDKELKDKIEVGFKVAAKESKSDPQMRLEALKLAYEVAFKQDVFNPTYWNKMALEKQVEAYKQIFELADYNYQYLVTGKVNLSE